MNIEDLDFLRTDAGKKKNKLTIITVCISVVCVLILVAVLIWLVSAFGNMQGIVEELQEVNKIR